MPNRTHTKIRTRLDVASLLTAALAVSAASAGAAEFRFRAQAAVPDPVVCLGDVADVVANDATERERLAALELIPAPTPGAPRHLRAREIQDLLILRGLNLAEHQFSGASQVEITSGGGDSADSGNSPLVASASREAHRRVHEAILARFRSQSGTEPIGQVEFELSPREARMVLEAPLPPTVTGVTPPLSGMQQLTVHAGRAGESPSFTIAARFTAPQVVVVAARALSRGSVVRETDVQLTPLLPGEQTDVAFRTIEEVIGKETTRALSAGQPLGREDLRSPILVRRGEVVTVYARAVGIVVKLNNARAKDDGGVGDLVAVETVEDRRSFLTRVCAPREVEVFPRSMRAD